MYYVSKKVGGWGREGGQMLMIADKTSPTYELLALFTNAKKIEGWDSKNLTSYSRRV